ncbi:MAG: hypothetical protein ACXWA9_15545 [Acidimicrobiia bacterium]
MSLTAPEVLGRNRPVDDDADGPWVEPARPPARDTLVVTCGACGARQDAPGDALGYTCHTCGSTWRVKRCRGCRRVSVVLDGAAACPKCGHEYATRSREATERLPSWLTDPVPLSVWLGGVKYLGGHAERDQPVSAAGLLLDRRGIHLRAFAELFTIRWDDVCSIDIEGPLDISERLTMTRLLELGATTWAMQVAYLTVRTPNGDAIFEVDGLGPPELHARLSRVLQGLQPSERPATPIPIERPTAATPAPAPAPAPAPEPAPVVIDAERTDAPLEVLIVDALWKLAHLREVGLLDQTEVSTLRAHLLARIPESSCSVDPDLPLAGAGPLLHV